MTQVVRHLLVLLPVMACIVAIAPAPAEAKGSKVTICHTPAHGRFSIKMNLPPKAANKHLRKHENDYEPDPEFGCDDPPFVTICHTPKHGEFAIEMDLPPKRAAKHLAKHENDYEPDPEFGCDDPPPHPGYGCPCEGLTHEGTSWDYSFAALEGEKRCHSWAQMSGLAGFYLSNVYDEVGTRISAGLAIRGNRTPFRPGLCSISPEDGPTLFIPEDRPLTEDEWGACAASMRAIAAQANPPVECVTD